MLLKISTPVPSSKPSLSKKLKSNILQIRGSSQTPTFRKKFSPHLNKSFNCYEEPSVLPSYNRQSPSILRDTLSSKKNKNRLRITTRFSTNSLFSQAKTEMNNKNYRKALDLLNKIIQEDQNIDILYCRGVCMMHLKLYNEAISDLKQVLEQNPLYDEQLYIALYMCYVYINDYGVALKVLTNALKSFPKCSKCYFLRGQLLNRLKMYEKALRDLLKVEDSEVNLHIAESLKGMNQYEKALKYYSIASQIPTTKPLGMIGKIKILYKLKRLPECLKEIQSSILFTDNNYYILYYSAKVQLLQGDLIHSGLILEQVIQNTNDQIVNQKALCKLAIIKIREKDFYGALHTFQRITGKLQSNKKQSLFRYTEAVISLMKRKFSEGIILLSVLIEEKVLAEYMNNCFVYRAYGYYATAEYKKCIEDYEVVKGTGELDKASEFNYTISKAILMARDNPKDAWNMFKSIKGVFSKNPMPEICLVCMLISETVDDRKILKKASRILDLGIKRRSDSEMLFIKSILLYIQDEYEKCSLNIKDCIDKAEENVATHYAVRGFCNIVAKSYTEAVQDFTIALQLNENLVSIYPYRGVSAYLTDDYNLALDDFLFYCHDNSQPSSILSAKLLLFAACYSDALQVLEKTDSNDEVLVLNSYCYMMLGDYSLAIENLSKVQVIDVSHDILYIQSIINKRLAYHGIGYIHNRKYSLWLKGLCHLYDSEYNSSIETFQDVLEIMHTSESEIFSDNIVIEEENCEVLYNIALCNTMNLNETNKEHALLILKELADVVNIEHRGQLFLICAIIELHFKNKESAEDMLEESAKCSPEICRQYLDGENVNVLPLHTGNEFSEKFPLLIWPWNDKIRFRPAVTMPKFLPPLELADTYEILKGFFSFNTVNPRPEAPWLNRNKGSIQFTDSILDFDVEESRKASRKLPVVAVKQCHSQEIRKKNSSFVKIKESQDGVQVAGLLNKIKKICA